MHFKLLFKEIKNRSENFDNIQNLEQYTFSIPPFENELPKTINYVDWSESANALFIKSSKFFNGPNIVLGDEVSCNEFFKINNFNGLNYLIYSLNPKSLVIFDDKRTFQKYKKENYIDSFYLNLFYRLIFFQTFDIPKFFLKCVFFIQIILNIVLLIFLRPSSIIITDLNKYWKLTIAAKILNIKNFYYVNDFIKPRDENFILKFLQKFKNSIPESAIYSSKYIFLQACGLNLEKLFSNYLLNKFNSKDKLVLNNKNQIITIIGFVNNFYEFTLEESFHILSFILNKLKKEYPKYIFNFLPISNFDHKLLNLINQKFEIIDDFEKLLNSEKIFSFYLNGSLQIYESFKISSTLITINNKYKNYLEAICTNVNGFNILNVDQKKSNN